MSRTKTLEPSDFLRFVELDEFRADWAELGLNVDDDLWELQICLMAQPEAGRLIEGTGSLRKLRFAPRRWQRGKRGSIRVCYAYFPRHWTLLLVMAYGKNRKDSLSATEKAGIREYLHSCERWLARFD